MAKKSIKSALSNTMNAEEDSVRDRFTKADSLITDTPRPVETASGEASTSKGGEVVAPAIPEKKVIRDTFSLPVDDYELIALIQQRCLHSAMNVTKGEVVRAGLKLLHALQDEKLLQALESVEKIKPGRPALKKR